MRLLSFIAFFLGASSVAHAALDAPYSVTFSGIGPVKVGMDIENLESSGVIPERQGPMGEHWRIDRQAREPITIMTLNRRVVLIESDSYLTKSGIKVGDTVEKAKEVYAQRFIVNQRPKSDGEVLDIFPKRKLDRGIQFYVHKQKLLGVMVGTKAALRLTEGCS